MTASANSLKVVRKLLVLTNFYHCNNGVIDLVNPTPGLAEDQFAGIMSLLSFGIAVFFFLSL